MSTKMSRDMCIDRSSTRLHAPPGGKTSISLGDALSTSAAPVKKTGPTSLNAYFEGADNVNPKVLNSKPIGEMVDTKAPMKPAAAAPTPLATGPTTGVKTISGNGYRVRQQPGGNSSIVIG